MQLANFIPSAPVDTLIIGKNSESEVAIDEIKNRFPAEHIFQLNQQHTNNCLIIDATTVVTDPHFTQQPADSALTDRFGVVLTLRTADCLPILLYHPSGIIGAIHAGRKGTDLGALEQSLLLLKARWGVEKDVVLWFGPAICKDCYQINLKENLRYNLREKNRLQAEKIFPNESIKIIDSEQCTFHHNHQWFSYRKEGKGVEHNLSAISLH